MAVIITDDAKTEVVELMKDSGYKDPVLRLSIAGFGWGGPRLGLVLDELEENENVVTNNDVKIAYDRRIEDYVNSARNITIDFRKDKYGAGFVILGGNAC